MSRYWGNHVIFDPSDFEAMFSEEHGIHNYPSTSEELSPETIQKLNRIKEVLDYLKLLYHEDEKGFSYFINKSQTHYYGINISKGKNQADIHGTILSVWAIVMILNLLEENIYEYKTIKP